MLITKEKLSNDFFLSLKIDNYYKNDAEIIMQKKDDEKLS